MDNKYKLKSTVKRNNYFFEQKIENIVVIGFIVMIITIIVPIMLNIDVETSIYWQITLFNITTFIGLIYVLNSFLKFSPKKFKKYGKKDIGYITSAYTETIHSNRGNMGVYRRNKYYSNYVHIDNIEVTYQNEKIYIDILENNLGFKILKMLLDPHFVKSKVPIDVYVYKNKIFADIESVDLTKVEGFDEIKDYID